MFEFFQKLVQIRRLALISLFFAFFIAPAHAGSAPEVRSSVKGFFLGSSTDAYFSVEQPKDYLDQIERICKSREKVWALGIQSPFICTNFEFIEQGGDGPVYGITLANKRTIEDRGYRLLFSVRPFPKPTWKVRKPTIAEIDGLTSNRLFRGKNNTLFLKQIKAGKAKVIEPSNGKMMIYLVPGRVTSDGIVEERDNFLVLKHGTGVYDVIEFRGEVAGLADLNGDGIPELHISTNCDGTCESVSSVVKQAPVEISISNH